MKIAFKYGLTAGIGIALWGMLDYFLLYKTFLSKISIFVDLIVLFTLIYKGVRAIKKDQFKDEITFSQASLSGVQVSLFASFVVGLLTFAYYSVGNKDYENFYIRQTIEIMTSRKMPDIEKYVGELKTRFQPLTQAQGTFFSTMLFGTVFSFVLAILIRNKTPEPSLRNSNNNN